MTTLTPTIDATLTEEQFKQVSDLIYRHCGINLHQGKKALVRARLAKRLRESEFRSFAEYLEYASSAEGADEFVHLVDSISTNLTSFFRENVHFEYLRNTYLPGLAAARNSQSKPRLRAWSAGCSTGEEPYSLAITLWETLPKPQRWDIRILASDVSTRVLQRGQVGRYDAERVAPLTPQQRSRFLTVSRMPGRKIFQVNSELQRIIRFRYLNLMDTWPFRGPFDIIMCRNVMIYFDKPTQARLIGRFFDCLAKGGLLCIGHSESLTGASQKFKYVMPATYLKP